MKAWTKCCALAVLAIWGATIASLARHGRGAAGIPSPPAVIQKAGNSSNSNSATTLSVTVTLGSAVTSGDAVGIAITYNGANAPTISSIVDNLSGTYSPALTPFQSANSGYMALVMKGGVTSGPTTFTITVGQATAGSLYVGAEAYEVSNLGTSPTLDAQTNQSGVYGTSFDYPFTTTGSEEFALAAYGGNVSLCGELTFTGTFLTSDNCWNQANGNGGAANAVILAAGAKSFAGTSVGSYIVATQLASWIPNSSSSLVITTSSLSACTVGVACSDALAATGGATPYSWSLVRASPNSQLWQYVTPSGIASGTPEDVETESDTYQVTDSAGHTAQATFALPVTTSGTLAISSPSSLSGAINGGAYAYQMIATGGVPPYIWAIETIAPPCSVTWNGWLECAPTATGTLSVPLQVTDSYGTVMAQTESITVGSALSLGGVDPVDGLIRLPPAVVGNAYRAALMAFGGTGTGYIFSATSGLPAWATLSSAGVITGTPTASGGVEPTLKVQDSGSNTATASALLEIANSGQVARPGYNSSPANGFFVLSGQLYDPNGYPFRLRGADRAHYDSSSWADFTNGALTGANSVRVFMFDGETASFAVSQIDAQYLTSDMATILTLSSTDGTSTSGNTSTTVLSDAVAEWVSYEPTLAPVMGDIILNVANEWGPAGSSTWETAYESAITSLRDAGYTCPILIDTGGSGQDMADILSYAQALQAYDPLQNLIFAYHGYGDTLSYQANISNVVSSGANTIVTLDSNLPYHPFWPFGGTDDYATGYVLSGVEGMTAINGTQPSSGTIGGSQGAWTITLTVNSSGYGTYTGGGSIVVNADYRVVMGELAALRADNVDVCLCEFGPGNQMTPAAMFTGSISGTTLTVSAVQAGPIQPSTSYNAAYAWLNGTGITANTYTIASQLTGSPGSTGTYSLSGSPGTIGSEAMSVFGQLGPSATNTSEAMMIWAAEANQMPWVEWAFDDHNLGPMEGSSWAGWFGWASLNTDFAIPADLTASGLDMVFNPRYGLYALASPAAALQ